MDKKVRKTRYPAIKTHLSVDESKKISASIARTVRPLWKQIEAAREKKKLH